MPLSILFPASLEPEPQHVNTADDINTTENKGRPKIAVNKKLVGKQHNGDRPAMNTRAKVSTTKCQASFCFWYPQQDYLEL